MSEKEKFNQSRYNNSYNKTHYDRVNLVLPKQGDFKNRIKAAADRDELSISQWILKAIEKELEWYE